MKDNLMSERHTLKDGLALVFQGIERLNAAFPHRRFTVDGRLVGDIGEVIAELDYDLRLDEVSQAIHDGTTSDGRRVQVKATFGNSLTFKTTPDYLLGIKLYRDGSYEEIYNGPGLLVYDTFAHRRGIGTTLLSFPNARLRELSSMVSEGNRVAKRSNLADSGT
ncbi:MAG: hypothetical protein AB1807_15955 [Pseudomonadota bacterium]